jgi:hypothetical protein
MAHQQKRVASQIRLVASLVNSPPNAFTWGDVDRSSVPDVAALVLQYSLDGIPLALTEYWRHGPKLVARQVARCLRQLQKGRGPLALVFTSPPKFVRHIGSKVRLMTSAEEVFLDWGLLRKSQTAGIITPIGGDRSSQYAETVVFAESEKELRAIDRLTLRYFDWHSFSGYVLPPTSKLDPRDLLNPPNPRSRLRTRLMVIRGGGIYFEDWDDGCGLKMWCQARAIKQLQDALPLADLSTMLRKTLPRSSRQVKSSE